MLINAGPGFEQFEKCEFCTSVSKGRDVFKFGSGPPVIVLHELFGAGPTLFRFAHRIADAGFQVYVPILFGEPNHLPTPAYALKQTARVCLSSEFAAFSSGRSSPIADWVRLLGVVIHERSAHAGLGVVGLCLTGSFALTLACEDWVAASVVSEPALPFGLTLKGKSDLHISPRETMRLKSRIDKGFEILAFRFKDDWFSPAERDDKLRTTLAPGVLGNGSLAPTCPRAHAVFTDHFDQSAASSTAQALTELLNYLKRKLFT